MPALGVRARAEGHALFSSLQTLPEERSPESSRSSISSSSSSSSSTSRPASCICHLRTTLPPSIACCLQHAVCFLHQHGASNAAHGSCLVQRLAEVLSVPTIWDSPIPLHAPRALIYSARFPPIGSRSSPVAALRSRAPQASSIWQPPVSLFDPSVSALDKLSALEVERYDSPSFSSSPKQLPVIGAVQAHARTAEPPPRAPKHHSLTERLW